MTSIESTSSPVCKKELNGDAARSIIGGVYATEPETRNFPSTRILPPGALGARLLVCNSAVLDFGLVTDFTFILIALILLST